jgi:TRAP-type mannitol/chloroaromatic compound transport system permease small subunit
MHKTIGLLDAALRLLSSAAAWLALPVVAALFLQWPLRDALQCCSREANDLGQWLFALYIAVAVTAATRAGTHLAADSWSKSYPIEVRRRVALAGALLAALPFALLVGFMAWPSAWAAVLRLETFGDTGNPGYFMVKASVVLMALLIGLQALVDLFRGDAE